MVSYESGHPFNDRHGIRRKQENEKGGVVEAVLQAYLAAQVS